MLVFYTSDPELLLSTYKKAVADGHVQTWIASGNDFTHTPPHMKDKAWMRPIIRPGQLVFAIVGRADENISVGTFGVYHGRFMESMLNHCDTLFDNCSSSALLVAGVDEYMPLSVAA